MAAFSDTTPSSLVDLNRLFVDAYILLIRETSKPRVKHCAEIRKQVRQAHTMHILSLIIWQTKFRSHVKQKVAVNS